jgi:hypothetical protein
MSLAKIHEVRLLLCLPMEPLLHNLCAAQHFVSLRRAMCSLFLDSSALGAL